METMAIDFGTRNFAYAKFTKERGFYDFGVIDLRDADKKKKTDPGAKVERLWEGGLFDSANELLLERQMVRKFLEMQNVLRGLWSESHRRDPAFRKHKAHLISPIKVKKYFQTSTGKHRTNKKAAIPLARSLLRTDDERRRFDALRKKDDVADCITMVAWWVKTH